MRQGFMKLFSLRRGFITLLLTGAVVLPQLVLAQDLADAKKMCADMTAQNRTMAKAAGYDIDKLCRSLSMQGAGGPTHRTVTISNLMIDRKTPTVIIMFMRLDVDNL